MEHITELQRAVRQLRVLIDAASEIPVGRLEAHLDQIGQAVSRAERGLEALHSQDTANPQQRRSAA